MRYNTVCINGNDYYYYSYEKHYTKYCKKHNINIHSIDDIKGYKHISKKINISISTMTVSNIIANGDIVISQSTNNTVDNDFIISQSTIPKDNTICLIS